MTELNNAITLCRAAGKLQYGLGTVSFLVKKKQGALLLYAKDLSEKSKKELSFLSKTYEVPCRELPYTIDEVWFLVGKQTGVLLVTQEKLAQKIESLLMTKTTKEDIE